MFIYATAALATSGGVMLIVLSVSGNAPIFAGAMGLLFVCIGFGGTRRANAIGRALVRSRNTVVYSPGEVQSDSFVLYLRCFADDAQLSSPPRQSLFHLIVLTHLSIGATQEQEIVQALKRAGDVIGVGKPGEKVPYSGAQRLYLPRYNWHEPVQDLMQRARLVSIVLGSGAGTLWEIKHALTTLPPERIVLLVPMNQERYDTFRRTLDEYLRSDQIENASWSPPKLPEHIEAPRRSSALQGVIYFSKNWESAYISLSPDSWIFHSLRRSLRHALSPVFKQLASEPQLGTPDHESVEGQDIDTESAAPYQRDGSGSIYTTAETRIDSPPARIAQIAQERSLGVYLYEKRINRLPLPLILLPIPGIIFFAVDLRSFLKQSFEGSMLLEVEAHLVTSSTFLVVVVTVAILAGIRNIRQHPPARLYMFAEGMVSSSRRQIISFYWKELEALAIPPSGDPPRYGKARGTAHFSRDGEIQLSFDDFEYRKLVAIAHRGGASRSSRLG
jgi:hypothetical protein